MAILSITIHHKTKRTKALFFLLVGFVLLLTGCNGQQASTFDPELPPPITLANFPRLDGSTSTSPLGTLIGCHFFELKCDWVEWIDGSRRLAPFLNEAEEFPSIVHNGTHSAYENLIQNNADLILVARLPSPDEESLAAALGVDLDPQPIALDAFVFLLHEDNPVDSLTTEELQRIYTGELTNWGELGGNLAEIHPYQRNENSGSQQLMKNLVMKDLKMVAAPEMLLLMKMIAPFYAVSEDPDGIGYSVYYYEENMAPNEYVKLCGVDGFLPDPDSIQSGAYPFTTEVYAVIREDLSRDSTAYLMREWLLSADGQVLIEESGYVPLN